MINRLNVMLLMALVLFSINCAQQTKEKAKSPEKPKKAKNVILLIGDGMGLSQVSAAFYYQDKQPNFQRFETIGLIKTSSSSHKITDSAAGATAFSAGVKTYNGAIGVKPDTTHVESLVEIASKKGMTTGLIATSSITHATPAAFFAHEKFRYMQDEIAAWLPESGVDYFAGGGLRFFDKRKRADGQDYLAKLREAGFEVSTDRNGINQKLDADKKYGFLLADNGMPTMQKGRGDFLPNAAKQALDYLSQSEEGFFLMVEGSQIDWGGHANDADYVVNEVLDFDKTLGIALDFASKDGNTLVVVTADHETGGFTLSSATETGEDGEKRSNYDKIAPSFSTGGHSATLIPVFAHGVGSNEFSGTYENTAIFDKIESIIKSQDPRF